MATVSPVIDLSLPVPRVVWEEAATGDTLESYVLEQQYGIAAAVQISGTFGGATAAMEVSNDGSTWFALKDLYGFNVSATANALFEISTSALYIRPAISGGTGDDIDVVMLVRGSNGV